MNRIERLYGIAERLRAAAPRLVTVASLAEDHGVSHRTIQRDLQALMASGVPVRYQEGRGGGWTVERSMTLPPVNLTSEEAAALLLAAAAARHAPLGGAAERAVAKVLAAVSAASARDAEAWRRRLHVRPAAAAAEDGDGPGAGTSTGTRAGTGAGTRAGTGAGTRENPLRDVERALAESRALRLEYRRADGTDSDRVVEPVGLLTAEGRWYLVAWCRTRDAVRGFRVDRIRAASVLDEKVRPRDLGEVLRHDRAGRGS